MQVTNRTNPSINQLLVAALVAALIATAPSVSGAEPSIPPAAKAAEQVHWVGVFTGEYVSGAPVYRLPAVSVSTSRTVELAKMAQEDRLVRAKAARLKASTHSSAPRTDNATMALNAQ